MLVKIQETARTPKWSLIIFVLVMAALKPFASGTLALFAQKLEIWVRARTQTTIFPTLRISLTMVGVGEKMRPKEMTKDERICRVMLV